MSNVIALTLRADAQRRIADGYAEVRIRYYQSVRSIADRQTAEQMAESHVDYLKRKDDEILAAVAVAMVEPEHA